MHYRLATIHAREAIAADGTTVIDLNLADCVSQFQIVYESTGVGAGEAAGHAAKCITTIELVDGSDVLFSLSGQETQAIDYYHNRIEPANVPVYLAGMPAEMIFNLNFGRFLYDPLYAFDPGKFTNPQLKITINRSAGGVSSVAGFLTVLAHIFDEKAPTPGGFLMHKEVKDYGMGSASHEYVDLPTDFAIRKLLIAAQTYGTGPEYLINTIKLSEDNDRRIPFNHTAWELLRMLAGQYAPYREHIIISGGASGHKFYCTPCYWPRVQAASWESSNIARTATAWQGDGGRGYVYLEAVGGNHDIAVEGWAPHGAIEIPFGLQGEPEDWYDVSKLGSLRLDILSVLNRSASDKVQVFLQQARPYA
ncbi:hypothetical protein ES702_05041 [subsurface metagenome]